jgi:phage recombination protein Bet
MSTGEILRINPQAPELPEWESKIDLVRRTVASGATPDELELFFHQARRAGLDPLAKQIYFVKRQGKGVVQVGIDGLRLIAERTGAYAGNDDPEFTAPNERGYPSSARVVVYKMVAGQRCPFSATARWDEYFPGDAQGFQWKRMPHAMLGKCAEALALRKAFPADMSGLYVHEEMEQAGVSEVVEAPKAPSVSNAAPIPASSPAAVTGTSSDERSAFGYTAKNWPKQTAFQEDRTDAQRGKAHATWKERELDEAMYGATRKAVLAAFGFGGYEKKGHMMIWIDFLMNASAESMNAAIAAAHAAEGQEALL